MPEAFGIKSGKSPNFGRIKEKLSYVLLSKPFATHAISFDGLKPDSSIDTQRRNYRIKGRELSSILAISPDWLKGFQ